MILTVEEKEIAVSGEDGSRLWCSVMLNWSLSS
jgi:hypothetical protein